MPIFEPLPPQYFITVESDRWLGTENLQALASAPHTAKGCIRLTRICSISRRFQSLPLVTKGISQSTASTRTLTAADPGISYPLPHRRKCLSWISDRIWKDYSCGARPARLHRKSGNAAKAVYIAPLKALARERLRDWRSKFRSLGLRIEMLTGDVTPTMRSLQKCDVIITTPEKWDGVSRQFHTRDYVRQTKLLIIDEIHLLGEDRGPVLEAVVSRMRYISSLSREPSGDSSASEGLKKQAHRHHQFVGMHAGLWG